MRELMRYYERVPSEPMGPVHYLDELAARRDRSQVLVLMRNARQRGKCFTWSRALNASSVTLGP